MHNLFKYFSLLTLLLSVLKMNAQVLVDFDLGMNPGGIVYDVEYVPADDVFIVVGDFEIAVPGEISLTNYAVINASDFSIDTESEYNVVSSIDGVIYTVDFYQNLPFVLPINHYYYIFIGGTFVHVNGMDRNGAAKFQYSSPGLYAPVSSGFSLDDWNPNLNYFHSLLDIPEVWTIEAFDDTVVIGGDFIELDEGYSYFAGYRVGLDNHIPGYITSTELVTDLKEINGNLYISEYPDDLGGTGHFWKYFPGGTKDFTFSTGIVGLTGLYGIHELEDTLLIAHFGYGGVATAVGDQINVLNEDDGSEEFDHYFDLPGTIVGAAGIHFNALAVYKDYIFSGRVYSPQTVFSFKKGYPGYYWEGSTNGPLNYDWRDHMFVARNTLIITPDNLTTAEGYSRNGFAMYCLEPENSNGFNIFDTTICQSDILNYSVSQADYADGYIWEYSGTGVDIGNTGAPENLSDTLYNEDVNAWAVEVRFTTEFTAGVLSVTPFSTCGNKLISDELLKARTVSINIDTNPLPNAMAGDDVELTCTENEVTLIGSSLTPDVIYKWNTLGGDVLDEVEATEYLVTENGDYVLTVEDVLGCLNFDTVNVAYDTIRPNFDPIVGPFDITCSDTVRSYLGFCNNLTDTTSYWVKLASNDTVSNPISVDLPGQYQFYTVNNENGCIDSLPMPVLVYLNQPSPNIGVSGYDEIPVGVPLDTLNCWNPLFHFEAYSDTASTILNWVEADSSGAIGAGINITESGNYYILAENTTNGCLNFVGFNIAEDFAEPNVILPEVTALNCSNDSLLLDGSTIFLDTILKWTGGDLNPAGSFDPVTIATAGTYYLTVTTLGNGCSAVDSLVVMADNSIDVFVGEDTVVCDESMVVATVIYEGDISGITYLWDNGTTDEIAFYTGGEDTFAVAEVFGDDDCYGKDTMFISIPPVPEIEFEAFQPCGEGATGSIIATPISGLAPFTYSIDAGATFQASPALTGLGFGTYTIWVKDSLDCLYEYSAVIDQSSDLPEPTFLFSTYNFQMDTVIVIDVSNPPTDSVNWVFSDEIDFVGELDGSPLITLPDTGSFDVTMEAYYGECLVAVTKEIFVSEFDSTYATFNNQNGIAAIALYPNPTTGAFTVEVEFYKKQRVAIAIQDMLGYVYEERSFNEVDTLTEEFELGIEAINGSYVFKVVSEFDAAYITFVLSR